MTSTTSELENDVYEYFKEMNAEQIQQYADTQLEEYLPDYSASDFVDLINTIITRKENGELRIPKNNIRPDGVSGFDVPQLRDRFGSKDKSLRTGAKRKGGNVRPITTCGRS